jgi:hypothetical protein
MIDVGPAPGRTHWQPPREDTHDPADVLKLIKEKEAAFADLRFTDTIGKEQHVWTRTVGSSRRGASSPTTYASD